MPKDGKVYYNVFKAYMVCLGFEPGVAGWEVQTNSLSYGSTLLI